MTSTSNPDTKEPRYPGSASFVDHELPRRLFYGRDTDTYELLQIVLAEPLVVLFGRSGVGKSSIINAGLKPRLRKREYFPMVVRVSGGSGTPFDALQAGVHASCEDGVAEGQIDTLPDVSKTRNLPELFEELVLTRDGEHLRPVLILDQFEELFLTVDANDRSDFIGGFARIVRGAGRDMRFTGGQDGRTADLRTIISIREDCIAHLEELADAIPRVLKARYRLLPLSRDQAEEAIQMPATVEHDRLATHKFHWATEADELLQWTLNYLCSQRSPVGDVRIGNEVEPAHLQLLCQFVEATVQRKGLKTVRIADTGGRKALEKVVENYYEATILRISREYAQAAVGWRGVRKRIRRLCEDVLIAPKGQRLLAAETMIEKKTRLTPQMLEKMVRSRLVRREPRYGVSHYELSHDTLTRPISAARDARRRRRLARRYALMASVAGLFALLFLQANSEVQELQSFDDERIRLRSMEPSFLDDREYVGELSPDRLEFGRLERQDTAYRVVADKWSVTVEEEGTLRITMRSNEFDTVLYAMAAGGFAQRNDDAPGMRTDSQVLVWAAAGMVDVMATSYSGDAEGQYTIRLDDGTREAPVVWGDNVIASLSEAGGCGRNRDDCALIIGQGGASRRLGGGVASLGIAVWNLELNSGQVVDVSVDAESFNPYVAVVTPNGDVVRDNDSGDGWNSLVRVEGQHGAARVVVMSIPFGSAGIYMIEAQAVNE